MFTTLRQLLARFHASWRTRNLDADFDQELETHLAIMIEDNIRRGLSREQARRAARLEFGGLAQLREAHREARSLPFLHSFLKDLQYAFRALRKNPRFSAAAVLTLAIGIGANTATFTALNATILRPLSVSEPSQFFQFTRSFFDRGHDPSFSWSDYSYFRENTRAFTGLAAGAFRNLYLAGIGTPAPRPRSGAANLAGFQFPRRLQGGPEPVLAALVSENYFQVLRKSAEIGQTFESERETDRSHAVLVGYSFWERRFARDPGVLGRNLVLNGVNVTVIGIMPRDFIGTMRQVPDLWVPIAPQSPLTSATDLLHDRDSKCCRIYGRLRAGFSRGQAEAELTTLDARLHISIPATNSRRATQTSQFELATVSALGEPRYSNDKAAGLVFIMGIIGFVLLIACANVASLSLARSAARHREIAVRLALGASRIRLIRQLLTESAVISLAAGIAGVGFSWCFLHFVMVEIGSLPIGVVAPDQRVLAYTIFLSVVATFAFGLAPALEASRPDLASALKDEGAAFGLRLRRSRLRDLMVGAQVAVCLAFLIAAGLLTRASQRALALDLGFNYANLISLDVIFPKTDPPGKVAAVRNQIAQQLESLPEVESIAVASGMPLAGDYGEVSVSTNGTTVEQDGTPKAMVNLVTPGYFKTMAIPILKGRTFATNDSRDDFNYDGSPVIVSEKTATWLWPGEDPVGKRLALGPANGQRDLQSPHSVSSFVIGIARDVRSEQLDRVDKTCLYLPVSLRFGGTVTGQNGHPSSTFVIRVRGDRPIDEENALSAIQRQFQATHPELEASVQNSRTAITNRSEFVSSRMGAIIAGAIGLLGLAMTLVGIYGVVSFAVAQRTQEIGIHMALGAQRVDVLLRVLSETMRPVAVGLAVGMVVAVGMSRLISTLLFGLSPLDPVTFLVVSASMASVALLAGYLPARRGSRVDPMIALRYE